MKIVIIGAGIRGLTAHLVCRRVGFEVEHYESEPRLGPAGGGIVLWSNRVKVLLTLGLGQSLERIGHRLELVLTRTKEHAPLAEMPVGDFERKLGAPVYPVSRTDLQAILVDAVGADNLHLGANCIGVEQNTSAATVYFADGRKAAGDVAVGVDGIRSVIRRAIAGGVAPRYSGMPIGLGSYPTTACSRNTPDTNTSARASAAVLFRWPATGCSSGLAAPWRKGLRRRMGAGAARSTSSLGIGPHRSPSSLSAARNAT
jgi:2-polyprenyl-6-methoxyphenol hydroxylase-like FAD-dependent oxidoreductase